MKSTDIKPGIKAVTKITGRDHVVTVIAQSVASNRPWIVRTPAGNNIYRSARQLRAVAEPLGLAR